MSEKCGMTMAIRWLAILAILAMLVLLGACATGSNVVNHAFGFNTSEDAQDGEVLDYRYGDSKLPVRAPESSVREGKPSVFNNVNGPMLKGDFLYVKWRNKASGQVYEDTVDLRQRLPANIEDHRIHFTVRGSQLYVYLISPERRPSNMAPNGPSKYNYRKVFTIYPDQAKQ